MQITQEKFGRTQNGEEVLCYQMQNTKGVSVRILNYGCTIQSLLVPDRTGSPTDLVLGYDTIEEYELQDGFLGATIGRHANRIGKGMFSLNGKEYSLALNDGENHLHGGKRGFDKYIWSCEQREDRLVFSHFSPDGTEGYPGNLQVCLTFCLDESSRLTLDYQADSDADTLVNLTNHSYFNLNGQGTGSIAQQTMQIFSDAFTENDAHCLPSGQILSVADTPFDFRLAKEIGRDLREDSLQLKQASGYDHNFVLGPVGKMKQAASAYSPESGIGMRVETTLPGIQFYTANFLTKRNGKNKTSYAPQSAFCLETQFYPNAMDFAHFPSPILRAGERYHHITVYQFHNQL